MPKKTSKDISCVTNHLDDEVYLTLKADNLNKDLLTRILNPESLNYSNLIELDTFEQALLIKSCQNKSKKNEYLLLLLPNEIYENYKEELKFENIRLEVEKYKDFEIPFEKNSEIINSILNLQNYYIEKYKLKSLKKNKKKE
jgi:hypothetical protein